MSLAEFTLPVKCPYGTELEIGAFDDKHNGWKIIQNAGQSIIFGNNSTEVGTEGSLLSSDKDDYIKLRCIVPDTTFQVILARGVIVLM